MYILLSCFSCMGEETELIGLIPQVFIIKINIQ